MLITIKDILVVTDPEIEIRIENIFGKILAHHDVTEDIEDDSILSSAVAGITTDGATLVIIAQTF